MWQRDCTKSFMVSIRAEPGFVNVVIKDGRYIDIKLRPNPLYEKNTCVHHPLIEKLMKYLSGMQVMWDISEIHEQTLTPFQKKLFHVLWNHAPYGQTITYGEVAKIMHSSPRGVATALKYNKLPIVLPCHRVVARKDLGGFSAGLKWKRYLLCLEGAIYESCHY